MSAFFLVGSWLLALQEAKPEFPSRDELRIVVIHDDQATCTEYPKTFRCPDVKHWVQSVNDVKCADPARVDAFIKSEAARFKTPDPKHPNLSELAVKLHGESGAPFSEGAGLMNRCAKMGIYKVDIGERKTVAQANVIASALGVGTRDAVDRSDLVVLIGKQEPEKNDSVRWVDGAVLKEVVEEVAKFRRPREEVSIVLDPLPSTPWTEVIRAMDVLRAAGFARMEFAAPRTESSAQKK